MILSSYTMRTSLVICGLIAATANAAALNANFMEERKKLAKEWSGNGGDPAAKYFHEASFSYHYDGRFTDKALDREEQSAHLSALITTYLSFMDELDVETWIMHGTLLAWWWNQRIFPWDDDLDVQVSEPGIHFLAENYNMTEHHFEIPGVPGGRKYMLEINPHYVIRTTMDWRNVIDGRWIDTSSGLFIDITAVRADDNRRAQGEVGALMCKDSHRFQENEIFPLRRTVFEGVPAKVPYAYTKLLADEYGEKSMTNPRFNGYTFSEEFQQWIKNSEVDTVIEEHEKQPEGKEKVKIENSIQRVDNSTFNSTTFNSTNNAT
ncbi:mannosylphosphorylation protein (Mnn4), putative [Talaromyces stipitatus ATCC 10500]|uniref:Mannosylphosphorylation protein (Mnn4), putative n=1 Tax=Talaromyces stipitatus (strain ATCC 10500 / CBS 375.48 / QM 6759 / NRRL 1006) TaxID=441959 RepID=B8MFG8_TALSN|nr:mannosylphosphorylation protein (Mnn4), putative [Talaromyces stipitatus ATCC 10500]EED16702.1 mannosylphosphorylation protein (Mnn4), putative [Talaromyces stipitatus ATCC 10500]